MKSFIVKVTKIVKTSVNLWLGFIEIINLFRFKKDLQTVKNLLKPKYVLNDLLSQKNTISLNLNELFQNAFHGLSEWNKKREIFFQIFSWEDI